MSLVNRIHAIQQHGFSLVEVLVALLILAVGLLGLAGLQLLGLRNNQTALYRSQATQMSYDIVDRIRANPAGNYNNGTPKPLLDCVANTCDPLKMAGYDLAQWNLTIQDTALGLPAGIGVVCVDSTPSDGTVIAGVLTHACDGNGNVYAVKVWWDERDRKNPGHKLFVMSFQL